MKIIKSKLFLSCHEATALIEKSREEKLSFSESVKLKLHTSMCKACYKYEKQSKLLDKYLISIFKNNK